MKPLIDALTKLFEKLFSAKMIWFIVVVVALLAFLLLWYGNGSLTVAGVTAAGCDSRPSLTPPVNDLLGLCTFINGPAATPTAPATAAAAATPATPAAAGQKQWIGLILLAAIILIGVKVVLLVIQGLMWVIKWLRDKLFMPPSSEPPA
jgi:hypothetical protein